MKRCMTCNTTGRSIPNVTPNDLRRTFASWMKNQGVDSAVVAALLGPKSTRMVDLVYGKLDPSTLAAATALLPHCDTGVIDKSGPVGRMRMVEAVGLTAQIKVHRTHARVA